jgi:hypothetical protein
MEEKTLKAAEKAIKKSDDLKLSKMKVKENSIKE